MGTNNSTDIGLIIIHNGQGSDIVQIAELDLRFMLNLVPAVGYSTDHAAYIAFFVYIMRT